MSNYKLNLILLFVCILLNACSSFKINLISKCFKENELTSKAIFLYLNSPDIFADQTYSKGPIKLDPILMIRDTIKMDDTLYFDKAMRSEELKYPLPQKVAQLTIPDSLLGKFRYTKAEKNYVRDYAIIYQFSPLLPTKTQNTFLIQNYIWLNSCNDTFCCREALRRYLKFKVNGDKITYIESLSSSDDVSDFIGLQCFSRRKLEEKVKNK